MAAEGGKTTRRAQWFESVNGAAAGWPRKVNMTKAPRANTTRQWGRGRMAAEGAVQGPGLLSLSRVNGAAAGWPRKVAR